MVRHGRYSFTNRVCDRAVALVRESNDVMSSSGEPRVVVFSLGGTIASTRSSADSAGVEPNLNAAAIIASVPGLSKVAIVDSVSFRQVPSGDLTISDLTALATEIDLTLESGIDGVVVTQGTDTIEETAFILDLLIQSRRPVVVTGAMRNPTAAGPDGPANLLAAVAVAASPIASDLGTLVVLNDEIHAARFVRKTNTSNLATFKSPNSGPVGWIVEGRPRIVMRLSPLAPIGHVDSGRGGAVALVRLALGDDDRIIARIASMNFSGAVVEGFGGGHVPATLVPALEALAQVMPVVLASRTGSGELLRETYGFPGSERDVLTRGLISAGSLDGLKSKILLSLILSAESELSSARERFESVVASILTNQ